MFYDFSRESRDLRLFFLVGFLFFLMNTECLEKKGLRRDLGLSSGIFEEPYKWTLRVKTIVVLSMESKEIECINVFYPNFYAHGTINIV